MFGWFKKKETKPKCRHYKEAGHPHPDNMVAVLRFSDYNVSKRDPGIAAHLHPFGIYQCLECGHRSFSASYLHFIPADVCTLIDRVISRASTMDALTAEFDRRNWTYALTDFPRKG